MSKPSLYCPSRSAYPISEHVGKVLKIHVSENKVHSEKNTVVWLPNWRELEKRLCGDGPLPKNLFSKFPETHEICNKRSTAKMFHVCQKIDPEQFSFWPETYLLPDEIEALSTAINSTKLKKRSTRKGKNFKGKKTFIVKPQSGAQGDGIFLVQTWRDLETKLLGRRHDDYLAQRYIENPLMIENKKFDIRIYLLISDICDRFEVWLCKEGMVRLCTEEYEKPKSSNLHNVCSHLTNYSLNKRSEKYEHSHDDGQGSKRTLSSLYETLSVYGIDSTMFQEEMETLAFRTAEAMQPYIQHNRDKYLPMTGNNGQCWQIFGLDVIAEASLSGYKLHLLEINANPSMSIDEICAMDDLTLEERQILPSKKFWVNGVSEPCNCKHGKPGHLHRVNHVDKKIKESVLAGALSILLPGVKPKWASKNDKIIKRHQNAYVKLRFPPAESSYVLEGLRRKFESLIGMNKQTSKQNVQNIKPLSAYKFRKYAEALLNKQNKYKAKLSILQADMMFSQKKKELCSPINFEIFVDLMLNLFVPRAFSDMFSGGTQWSADLLMDVLQLKTN